MAVTPRSCKIPRTSNGGGDDEDDGDRLSSLPEHIIRHIFSFLDTINVVRASSVSRKWRYFSVSVPHLNLNIFTFWLLLLNKKDSMQVTNEKFKDFVNWVLMSQDWSVDIQNFSLYYWKIRDDNIIYRWMNVLARRNVQQLYLRLFSDTPLELPLCIINCESLVDLKICFDQYSVLKLPESPGFTRLKFLYLSMVEFMDSMLLGNFVSSCPVLENLTMDDCTFHDFKILDIAAPRLKNLIIDSLTSADEDLFNCEVIVACPSLVSFKLLGTPSGLSFPGTNGLQNVFIFFNHGPEHRTVEEGHHLMDSILRGICNIKVLKLSAAFLGFLLLAVAKPECSAAFYNLKSLTLLVSVDESDQSTIQFLNHSPNLEALSIIFTRLEDWGDNDVALSATRHTLVICGKSNHVTDSCKMPNDDISCMTYHLKKVELIDVACNKNELELVKFLLKNGHVLQKMSIRGKYLNYPTRLSQK
ncbi:hypothetical protein Dsin_022973 [Dipteronia sinensis]|uniref:F-box domain-containing protein n=1 Tax=Dipteronia sinensis TaxID=43782 RepID=A0AAE0A2E1_9ROSI|nr:hypothetical protein Dsin_022973 [Dipteronia sinensis]